MTDERIGTITNDGIQWPEKTISGQSYSPPPTQYRNIGGGRIVVLDPFPAVDRFGVPVLDVEAEIAKLKAVKEPKAVPADAPKEK